MKKYIVPKLNVTSDRGMIVWILNELKYLRRMLKAKLEVITIPPTVDTNENSTKIIGGFYYPSQATNPDWISAIVSESENLSWDSIAADLDVLVNSNVNTIRITIFSSLSTYGVAPLLSDNGSHSLEKVAAINTFLEMCKSRNLKVMTQTTFGFEGKLSDNDIITMKAYLEGNLNSLNKFNSHIEYVTGLIEAYPDVVTQHIILNEPDGFGTWGDEDKAMVVLNFLYKLKEKFQSYTTAVPYLVNAVDHINFNLRFPEMQVGAQSLYEISDWATFNSYYWADNGFYPYVHYRRQFEYMIDNNYDNKPLMMLECGFPSDYSVQELGEASFIPYGGQFDRPPGSHTMTPHTEESQERSIKEAVYFSELHNTIGIMCWSLFKHVVDVDHPFQDSFGLITENREKSTSMYQLSRAFTKDFSGGFKNIKPLSITSGATTNGGHINGHQGYNVNDTPAGVYLPQGATWTSDSYTLRTPYKLVAVVEQLEEPVDNGLAFGIDYFNRGIRIHVQFEDYSNRWRYFENDVEIASTVYAETVPGASLGLSSHELVFDFSKRDLEISFKNVPLLFYTGGDVNQLHAFNLDKTLLQEDIKLYCNATTSPTLVKEVYLKK